MDPLVNLPTKPPGKKPPGRIFSNSAVVDHKFLTDSSGDAILEAKSLRSLPAKILKFLFKFWSSD